MKSVSAGRFAPMQNGLALGFNIGFDVADVNNDGAADVAVASGDASVYFFDTATSTWQSISTGLPTSGVKGIRLADMDMDGSTEVVIWSSRNLSIYKADSDFQWSQIASFGIAEAAPDHWPTALLVDAMFASIGAAIVVVSYACLGTYLRLIRPEPHPGRR